MFANLVEYGKLLVTSHSAWKEMEDDTPMLQDDVNLQTEEVWQTASKRHLIAI